MIKAILKRYYRLVDYYESYERPEIVGKYETRQQATKAATQRALDTDGECDLALHVVSVEAITDWNYPEPKEWGRS